MRSTLQSMASAVSLVLLAVMPLACVNVVSQAAMAQADPGPVVGVEDAIARLLATVLSGAGIPAAIVSILAASSVAVCRIVTSAKPVELRLTIDGRQLLVSLGGAPEDPTSTPRQVARAAAPAPARAPEPENEPEVLRVGGGLVAA